MKYEPVCVARVGERGGFEPLALPAYVIIALGLIGSAILVVLTGFEVRSSVLPAMLIWPYLAFAGMLLRRIQHRRLAAGIEATALIYGQGFAFLFGLFPLTALGAPLADPLLDRWDRALGLDWAGYAWAAAPFLTPLTIAYKSLSWQPLLIIPILAWPGKFERLWIFVTASALALLITVSIYPFVPAVGAVPFYHLAGYPMNTEGLYRVGRIIGFVREHRVISAQLFTAFVSFPSYHAAAALLFTWAAWPTSLRYPILLLNITLCASAPVVGGHFLVDIPAGFAVAVIALCGAHIMIRARWVALLKARSRQLRRCRSSNRSLVSGPVPRLHSKAQARIVTDLVAEATADPSG